MGRKWPHEIEIMGKRLGIEFGFAIISYLMTIHFQLKYCLTGDLEWMIFAGCLAFEATIYLNLAFSNPGRLSPQEKTILNEKVTIQFDKTLQFAHLEEILQA